LPHAAGRTIPKAHNYVMNRRIPPIGVPTSPLPAHDITRIVLMVLVIALMIGGSFWILRPFLPALVWATMIVVATWPVMAQVERLLWRRRWLAVAVMTLAFLVLVIAPVIAAIVNLVDYVPDVSDRLKGIGTLTIPQPPEWLAGVPLIGEKLANEWRTIAARGFEALAAQLAPYAKIVGTWLLAEAGGLGVLVINLLLTIVLTAVLYAYGETAANAVLRFARRLGGERGTLSVELAGQAIRAVALGIIVTARVQTALAGVGLIAAGVPYASVLTALIFLFCVAQIGPGVVLFAAVAWLYWKDQTLAAILLLVWSVIVVMLDNVLRPMLIRRGADLPLLLIMAGVIGGLLAFGVLGLFVGPVVLAVTYTLLDAWIEAGRLPGGAPPMPARSPTAKSDAA
jgi:predicted PurR-regulated permease PerM